MIEKLLMDSKVPYKLIDEDDGFKLVKINSKLHVLYLYGEGNKFLMERDFFDYIDGNTIPYSILCHDTLNNKLYYLKLNKNVNWVKSCFQTCDKDSLHLGKNVFDALMSVNALQMELLKYK